MLTSVDQLPHGRTTTYNIRQIFAQNKDGVYQFILVEIIIIAREVSKVIS